MTVFTPQNFGVITDFLLLLSLFNVYIEQNQLP